MAQTIAFTVGKWFGPKRHQGHVLRDLALIGAAFVTVAAFLQSIR
jgi:hypothetical protein